MADAYTRWAKQWELFHEASEAPDPEAWLRDHCEDEALRRRVLDLLAASNAADAQFLPTDGARIRESLEAARELMTGDRVGPYELLEVLGEGGMGRVFLAGQHEPLDRRVALKVIRRGFESEELLARFEAERQILARLTHPHVAGVLDAGLSSDGRPYFVMEAVEGLPIDTYCDENGLAQDERIRLMITVCEAVQHAHHKGIIHRDLKPSNVLVADIDGRPVPKVIDFGIAKLLTGTPATSSRAPDDAPWRSAVETRFGQLLGTPEFMSPEQVSDAGAADIDSRTDVFALGLMLSYLLTGGPPAAFPEPPSASSKGSPVVPELSWIIERATSISRDERYASCSELAADLTRFLTRQPVLAGPGTFAYRFGKLVQRHRLATSILASSIAILLLLTLVLALQTVRLNRALQEASAEVARRGTVTDFLVDLFRVSDPELAPSMPRSAREILDVGAERVLQDLDDPEVYLPLAQALGDIYGNLGEYERQVEMYGAALESQLEGGDAQHGGEGSLQIADTLHRLGQAETKAGRWDEAEGHLQAALERRREELGDEHLDTLETLQLVGNLYFRQGRNAESEQILRAVLKIHESAGRGDDLKVTAVLHSLGNLMYTTEHFDVAMQLYERERAIVSSVLPADDLRVTATLNGLARVHERLRENETAVSLYRQIIETRGEKLGDDHPEIALYRANLALALTRQQRFSEALEVSGRAVVGLEQSLGTMHPDTLQVSSNHAVILAFNDQSEASIELLREIQARMETTLDMESIQLRSNLASQARRLSLMGRWQEALEPLERLMQFYQSQGDQDTAAHMRQGALYGQCLSKTGRLEDGERWMERALAFHLETFGPADRRTLETWQWLQEHFDRTGNGASAAAWSSRLETPGES